MKKHFVRTIVLVFALLTLLPAQAFAAGTGYDILLDTDGSVKVTSVYPGGGGIASMQVTLVVNPESTEAAVDFHFAEGLPAKVQEYRYDSGSGQLVLYLAGTEALFGDDSTEITVGTVTAMQNGKSVAAEVRVAENGLKLANGAKAGAIPVTQAKTAINGQEEDSQDSESGSGSDPEQGSEPGSESDPEQGSKPESSGDSVETESSQQPPSEGPQESMAPQIQPQSPESSAGAGGTGTSARPVDNGTPAGDPATGDKTPILFFTVMLIGSGIMITLLAVESHRLKNVRRRRRVHR